MSTTLTSAQAQADSELVQVLNRAIPGTVGACLLGTFLAAMCAYFTARDSIHLNVVPWSTSSLACSFFADVVLSTSITWYLLQGTGVIRKSDRLIRQLVIYTVNIVFSACTLLTLIFNETLKYTLYDEIPYFLLSKCYVNSVLAFSTPTTPQLRTISNSKSAAKTPPRRNSNIMERSTTATSQTLDPVMATDDVPEALNPPKPSV
ncbi:hypothetical protein Clacol_001217 [Clathrus columnatus]|uniref:DUF6534 domain-containing protein n=1 Tax=Clathrus columnatus TaxID=1419009 RepID=A0AAV4ZXV7_9AGAM|nr:hypothetical protein Clacol_001217 [Clathrus columnatus]